MKKTTMTYTHQEAGGYKHTDTGQTYGKTGELQTSDVFESPAYSGHYVREITFLPDDRRLPNKHVAYEEVKNPAAVALGRLGGSVKSDKKSKSSAANGSLGGRPQKVKNPPTE